MAGETKGVWNLEYRNLHAAAKMDWVSSRSGKILMMNI